MILHIQTTATSFIQETAWEILNKLRANYDKKTTSGIGINISWVSYGDWQTAQDNDPYNGDFGGYLYRADTIRHDPYNGEFGGYLYRADSIRPDHSDKYYDDCDVLVKKSLEEYNPNFILFAQSDTIETVSNYLPGGAANKNPYRIDMDDLGCLKEFLGNKLIGLKTPDNKKIYIVWDSNKFTEVIPDNLI